MDRLRLAVAAAIALTLAGCAGGPSLTSDLSSSPTELAMPGRWMLSAPNAPACGMNFYGPAGRQ